MQDFRRLRVWVDSVDMAALVYRATEALPRSERYGLRAQVRASAVSVSSNIAEGCGRRSNRELLTFLYIAAGSVKELACQLRIATDLGYGDPSAAQRLDVHATRVAKMLARLITFLRNQPAWRNKEGSPG